MGLFDFGNEDMINAISGTSNPKYNPVDLDEGTKGLIDDSVSRSNSHYHSSDIDKNASMLMPKGGDGLLSSPGTGMAIANKYSQLAGEKIQALKTEQGRTETEHDFARTGMAFDNLMKKQQVQTQNYEAYLQQIKNEQWVRAQTLNTMLGGAAQVGGAAAGSSIKSSKGGGKNSATGMRGNGNAGAYGETSTGESYGNYDDIG